MQQTSDIRIETLLEDVIRKKASDLHLQVGLPPMLRVDGSLVPIAGMSPLDVETVEKLVFAILDDDQQQILMKDKEFDFSFAFGDLGRFRVNAYHERGNVAAALRLIPNEIKSITELNMPQIISNFAEVPRGVVLVTGPTGSGKSTTLAAIIDKINTEKSQHIITIEDPIEFTHKSKKSVVVQREVHYDTYSFSAALRSSLRQDPDVVLVGEMRDLETIESALRIAETGHLTLATLHTNSAASTINRIIDVFPSDQQSQIRAQLSLVLEGIMCQALLPRAEKTGRAMALEIMIPNSAIRNLIREDKVHQIYSMMQTGQDKYGMQTFNQALATLYHKRQITLDTAMLRSSNTDELKELIDRGSGLNSGNGSKQHPSPYAQARPIGTRPSVNK